MRQLQTCFTSNKNLKRLNTEVADSFQSVELSHHGLVGLSGMLTRARLKWA